MKRAVSVLLMSLLPTYSMAAEDGYICSISTIQELGATGKLSTHKGIYAQLVGSNFSIDRSSGKVIGLPFASQNWAETKIMQRGDNANSFKLLITSSPPNIWVKYIYVKEFQDGHKKPFWGGDGDMIYSGMCE